MEDVMNAKPKEPLLNLNGKRTPSPILPPSPVSPARKRPRTAMWDPPEHIPDFLPPFPTVSTDDIPVTPAEPTPTPAPHIAQPAAVPFPLEEKPSVTLSQSLTTAAASDILVQVPYSQSTLASVPDWHLPLAPPQSPRQTKERLPVPAVDSSLISAYHHILTHPPPPELAPLNPSRHKVAMALIQRSQKEPRWNPADTLFGSVGPCAPRVATIQPSYPVAISDQGSDQDLKLPPTASRPVAANERLASFISQQTSRIPSLARDILPVRTSSSIALCVAHPWFSP